MSANNRNILIVDDHPMTVDGYKTLLKTIDSNSNASFYLEYDCAETYRLMLRLKEEESSLHYAFIDVNLPPFEEKNIKSGVDLAIEIRTHFPQCKIVIISMHKEPLWVNQILKSIDPEGFIAKSDINYKSFPEIFISIEKGKNYQSESIVDSHKLLLQKNIKWDEYDSQILRLIADGVKTGNLPHYIPLSLSAIEKRKANIKKQFVYDTGSDKEIIDTARMLGFI